MSFTPFLDQQRICRCRLDRNKSSQQEVLESQGAGGTICSGQPGLLEPPDAELKAINEQTREESMLKGISKALLTGGVALSIGTAAASAAESNLRIQTHFSPETLSGKMAAEFIEDVTAMSNGEIKIEMFYASAVVKSSRDIRRCRDWDPRLRHDGRCLPDRQESGVPVRRRPDGRVPEPLPATGLASSWRRLRDRSTNSIMLTTWNSSVGGSQVLSPSPRQSPFATPKTSRIGSSDRPRAWKPWSSRTWAHRRS